MIFFFFLTILKLLFYRINVLSAGPKGTDISFMNVLIINGSSLNELKPYGVIEINNTENVINDKGFYTVNITCGSVIIYFYDDNNDDNNNSNHTLVKHISKMLNEFLHLHKFMEGLYFHCNLSVYLSVCLCVRVRCFHVNKIPAEWIN